MNNVFGLGNGQNHQAVQPGTVQEPQGITTLPTEKPLVRRKPPQWCFKFDDFAS